MIVDIASSDHSIGNVGAPTVSDHVPAALLSDEGVVPRAVADEDKLGWKSPAAEQEHFEQDDARAHLSYLT